MFDLGDIEYCIVGPETEIITEGEPLGNEIYVLC